MPLPGERLSRAEEGTAIKLEGRNLPPRSIVIQQGWNPRSMSSDSVKQSIESLKTSIRARINAGLPGLFKPIQVLYIRSAASWRGSTVEGGTPLLVDGERRLLAYLQLWDEGLEANIPVTDTDGDEAQLRAASIIANDGLPLTDLEIGRQCKILRDGCCKSVEWIAENIGKSQRFVTEAIALNDAPEEAKALVASGEVTPSAVRSAWKSEVKQAQEEHRAPEPKRIVEPLRKAVADRPAERQATLPGLPTKPRQPIARPKKESAKEKIAKVAPSLLELADAMYKAFSDLYGDESELPAEARAYWKARNR
jgi:hypothetical protein